MIVQVDLQAKKDVIKMPQTIVVRDLERQRQRESQQNPDKQEITAFITPIHGTVRGSRGWNWLNFQPEGGGNPGQARNDGRILGQSGLRIKIKYIDDIAVTTKVDYDLHEDQNNDGSYRSPKFAQHGVDHGWASGDPDYLDIRRIIPLMIKPIGQSIKVKIYGGYYSHLGQTRYYSGTTELDLSSFQPAATGTKVKVGIYLDNEGTLQTIEGLTVAAAALTIPNPDFPNGSFALGLVIIRENQAWIDFTDIKKPLAIWSEPSLTLYQIHLFS